MVFTQFKIFYLILCVNSTYSPDTQEPLLCTAVKGDTNGEIWKTLVNQIEGKSTIRDRLLSALSCTNDEQLLAKYADDWQIN